MRYMGSKNRLAKDLLSVMLPYRHERCWVEPFVGGGNMIDKLSGWRIGADSSPWAIAALTSIRDSLDELPKTNQEFTESDYKQLRSSDMYKHKGYAGFTFSFGGKWLGGWSRDTQKNDYVAQAYRNAQKQSVRLQGTMLLCCQYDKLLIPPRSLVYCDPPYACTTSYTKEFDHTNFWEWCRQQTRNGHIVFVSEYSAPSDFQCVWHKDVKSGLRRRGTNSTATEGLFTLLT